MEKVAMAETNEEIACNVKLLETDERIWQAYGELITINYTLKLMQLENVKIRGQTEAYKGCASKMKRELEKIVKRGEGYEKRIADMEKDNRVIRSQREEEEKRVLEATQDVLKSEKEAAETVMKWVQETKALEELRALVALETEMAKTQKARSRAFLSELRQEVDAACNMAEDEHRRLEAEVSRLRNLKSRPTDDPEPVNLDFKDNNDEAAPSRSKSHLLCMMCMQNVVTVIFLPCTHQVVCFSCYEGNDKSVGACCPYCSVGIERAFKVYRP